MRNVILARTAGFCFGVQWAVDTAYSKLPKRKDAYVWSGSYIMKKCQRHGEKREQVVHSIEEASHLQGGTMIIRSHGASKNEIEQLKQMGFEIVDATCPFVKKIHRIVEDYSEQGYGIIIIGSADHPEVQAISGWCKERR